ncbi:hypothetical protein MRS44_012593 [Fusarium solani]|uniref:uncharacterized protein n=1 Tax=Fusarium solani TaxID=169388 RepID=UPI0032C3DA00|nr:hypothetical protein MRS44_012593 [Fusarium solani]
MASPRAPSMSTQGKVFLGICTASSLPVESVPEFTRRFCLDPMLHHPKDAKATAGQAGNTVAQIPIWLTGVRGMEAEYHSELLGALEILDPAP